MRDARLLIVASLASQLGDWLYNAALLGYVFETTGSAGWVGAATIVRLLPYVVLGPVGGVIADRYDRRKVLVVGDVLRSALMLLLAVVIAANGPVAVVLLITAASSAAGTAERPAALALLPRLVGESRLGRANALLHTVQDVGVVVGPAIGAVLLAVAPAEGAFVANGATFAVSALLVASIRTRVSAPRSATTTSPVTQLRDGIRTARRTRYVLPLVGVVAMAEFVYGAQTVQLVLFAENELDLGASGYGYLLSALGVGGVLSLVVSGRLASSTRVSIAAVATTVVFCATELVYAGSATLALALVATVVGGASMVASEVVVETALPRITSSEVLGRVMGAYDAVVVGAMVAGAAVAPVLVAATSLSVSLVVVGLVGAGVATGILVGLRGLDAASAKRRDTIAANVAVLERLRVATGVPKSVIEQLASSAQMCPLPVGVDIVVEGAPAHAFYAVVDGAVAVHHQGDEIARLGPGDTFGERGLLDRAPRNASVTTVEPSTVLRIEGDTLLDALQTAPVLLSTLGRAESRRQASAPTATALVDDPAWDGAAPPAGRTLVVIGAGYEGKRRVYARLAELGVKTVIVEEPGHWSEGLVDEGVVSQWVPSPIVGDADVDAEAVLDALRRAGVRPDGVLTYWEDSTCVTARVAAALGLPGNPPDAVDAARSKVRTRELSAELGLPTPKAQRVRSLDELFDAASEIGFPAVVKPEFGAAAMGCVRVDDMADLPGVYALVRDVVRPETDSIFRAGNDLLLEEYLDGVEFDVDLVMHEGECVFSSVSQNWPTAEPSFQETGLHIPPDHDQSEVRRLVDLAIRAAQAFGLHRGVLHIEGKCTTRGPRIVEVNARMGGGRVWEMVQSVWDVDLVEAHARAFLGLPPSFEPARRPQCGIVDTIVHASRSGRLAELSIGEVPPAQLVGLDDEARVGDDVNGPEHVFASVLVELVVRDKNVKRAQDLATRVLQRPPVIESRDTTEAYAPGP